MDTFLFATGNPGKRREFQSLLGDFLDDVWRVYDLDSWPDVIPEVVEDGETFWENAVKKALEVSQATGSVALADDSGLEVDALGGAPGVYSARYAGPEATDADNNRKLIAALEGVPEDKRGARYVAVVALAMPDNHVGRALMSRVGIPFDEVGRARPTEEGQLVRVDDRLVVWFRGTVEGRIIDEARGSGGFGYDPHFWVDQWAKTMAEVGLDKKNEISHRAEALEKMEKFFWT